LKTVVSGHQELAAMEKRISDEKMKNCYLQRDLKNDLHNLEEQLKEQKKAHQGRPLSSLEYFSVNNLS
jgi:peptidoglycan hydrolase CwlO-like protein